MPPNQFISIKTLCLIHEIEESFVHTLDEYDILHLQRQHEDALLHVDALPLLEKMIRLHKDLNINPEGLQAINELLQKVQDLQQELEMVRRRLDMLDDFY